MAARSKQANTRREPQPVVHKPTSHAVQQASSHKSNGHSVPLRSLTEQALDSYFASLNGHAPGHLYDLVMREVEEPLFRAVLDFSAGNQSRAADILGINRGTLRKKLRVYGIAG